MKKGVSKSIAFILIMSLFPCVNAWAENLNVSLNPGDSVAFNDDLFLEANVNVTSSYASGGMYYDGQYYSGTVTIDSIDYTFYGDMSSRADDVIKIGTSDVTLETQASATKTLGLVIFSRETGNEDISVVLNYEDGKTETKTATVNTMTHDNGTTGKHPLKISRVGASRYKAEEDTSKTVYLQTAVLDLSGSVNKNLSLESITLKADDFTYYLAAVTQIKFSDEEIEEQTRETVSTNYNKYKDMNFVQVVGGENDASISGVTELYSAMLRQEGEMAEATAENIAKIKYLVESSELYSEISGYLSGINAAVSEYADVSADFTELSETELTAQDYQALADAIDLYESYDNADIDAMNEAIEEYNLTDSVDISIDADDRAKINALYDAYTLAKQRSDLRAEIEVYYNDYIDKDISEITASDFANLEALIAAFDNADEQGVVFEEYNSDYIRHLYNDYDKYQTSENEIYVEMSDVYNVDIYAEPNEIVNADTWYECKDNLNGSRFKSGQHASIVDYNNGVITVKEYEYVETSTYDPTTEITKVTYPFTATENTISYKMPNSSFSGNILDALLVKTGSKNEYVFKTEKTYADKVYFVFSSVIQNVAKFEPVIKYTDGTVQTISMDIGSNGIVIQETRNKKNTYPNLISYVTSGNYKDQARANNGAIYEVDGSTTNGKLVFAAELYNDKQIDSITIKSGTTDYALSAISLKPVANDVIAQRTTDLYQQVVTDGEIASNDIDKISSLVLNYNDAKKRGLYVEGVDADIIETLSQMVLTASGSAKRYDKNTVKAVIEFSVAVEDESLEGAISVTSDEKAISFDYDIDNTSKVLTLDIPVDKNGKNKLTINISDTVKIKNNTSISMVAPFEIIYTVPEYISAAYNGNYTLVLTNNSEVDQSVIAYAAVKGNDTTTYINSSPSTVNAGNTKNVTLDTMLYQDAQIEIAVVDEQSMASLCELSEVKETTKTTVASADYTAPTLDLNKNVLKVEGFTTSKKQGVIITAMVYSPIDALIYAGQIKTNKDGYFSFEIPVNPESISASGNLKIKLGSDDFTQAYENNDVYFPIVDDRTDIVTRIKNATPETNMVALMQEAQDKLSLNFVPFIKMMENEITASELAARVYEIKGEIPTISEQDSDAEKSQKVSQAQKIIKQQAVLLCIEKGNMEHISKGVDLIYDDVVGYSSIDTQGVTIYEIYCTQISDTGKTAIITAIKDKDYSTVSDMLKDFKAAVMLQGFKNPKNDGVGHVAKLLTKANADSVNIEISEYLALTDKSTADSYIANMTVNTLKDVTDYIDTLDDDSGSDTSNNNSSDRNSNKTGISIVPTQPVINPAQTQDKTETQNTLYKDVAQSHWAYSSIEELSKKGIINGKGDSQFAPEDTITRAEFVKLLCVAKGISTDVIVDKFTDVTANDWYAPYVSAALNAGIINGISETEFGANMPITRQDICTIVSRIEKAESENELNFADSESISEYARAAVAYLSGLGVINGFEDNTFRPNELATRAQAAVIMCKYLNSVQ